METVFQSHYMQVPPRFTDTMEGSLPWAAFLPCSVTPWFLALKDKEPRVCCEECGDRSIGFCLSGCHIPDMDAQRVWLGL